MANNMGVDSLKANLTNPARSYLWDVIIPVPIGGGDSLTYQLRAQSTEIPEVSVGTDHIPYKQTGGVEVAGRKSYTHTWTCTFLEGEDMRMYDALYEWCQKIVHDVAGIGVGDPLYKSDCYVNLLGVDGSTTKKFKLKGAWVQTIGSTSLSYDTDGVIRYNVTFRFDSFEVLA